MKLEEYFKNIITEAPSPTEEEAKNMRQLIRSLIRYYLERLKLIGATKEELDQIQSAIKWSLKREFKADNLDQISINGLSAILCRVSRLYALAVGQINPPASLQDLGRFKHILVRDAKLPDFKKTK